MIDFYKSDHTVIEIKTAWQDHCDIEYDYDDVAWNGFKLDFSEDLLNQKLTIAANPPMECEELKSSPIKLLKLTVPEMLNVSIIAHHMDLRVKNKVEESWINAPYYVSKRHHLYYYSTAIYPTILILDFLKRSY